MRWKGSPSRATKYGHSDQLKRSFFVIIPNYITIYERYNSCIIPTHIHIPSPIYPSDMRIQIKYFQITNSFPLIKNHLDLITKNSIELLCKGSNSCASLRSFLYHYYTWVNRDILKSEHYPSSTIWSRSEIISDLISWSTLEETFR